MQRRTAASAALHVLFARRCTCALRGGEITSDVISSALLRRDCRTRGIQNMRFAAAILLLAVLAIAPAQAAIVNVTVTGQVVFNEIDQAPLNGVVPGTDVVVSFQVNSDDYVDGMLGFTRSYAINPSSFTLTFDSLVQIGLQDPFPDGRTPYFTLFDGFAGADGFFIATSSVLPNGVPLATQPYDFNLD